MGNPTLLHPLLFGLIILYWLIPQSHAANELKSLKINGDDKVEIALTHSGIHEECIRVNQNQTLEYVFEASKPLDFNLHHHIDSEVIYPISETGITSLNGAFNPEIRKAYCLMWTNNQAESVDLAYRFIIRERSAKETPVSFRIDKKKENINITDDTGKTKVQIKVGFPIHNFGLNQANTLLAVLTSTKRESVLIFDVASQKLQHTIQLPQVPRFLAFSQDDQFLALTEEHSNTLILLDTANFKKIGTLSLPDSAVALDTSDQSNNQLLVRTASGIIKIGLKPLKIIDKNAKVPVKFGEKTVYINPTEWCFVHGVPHPLYYPTSAMSSGGLKGTLPPGFVAH